MERFTFSIAGKTVGTAAQVPCIHDLVDARAATRSARRAEVEIVDPDVSLRRWAESQQRGARFELVVADGASTLRLHDATVVVHPPHTGPRAVLQYEAVDVVARRLLTVRFASDERDGVYVTPTIDHREVRAERFRVELRRPDNTTRVADAYATQMLVNPPPPAPFSMLVLLGLTTADVPLGTEVWVV